MSIDYFYYIFEHMVIYIYALIDPRNDQLFYVGKTNNPSVRLKTHRAGQGKTRCAMHIREIRSECLRPNMNILEECSESNWEEREREWIRKLKPIANTSDGGQPGRFLTHSEITKQRLRDMFKGRPISPKQKAQISRSLTGLVQAPHTISKRMETINANRVARGLEPRPIYATQEEYIQAQREKSKLRRREKRRAEGRPIRFSPEWFDKQKRGMAQWSSNMPPEMKEIIRAKKVGRPAHNRGVKYGPQSEERRALQSEKMRAYTASLTPEQREARMTAARVARKAKLGY